MVSDKSRGIISDKQLSKMVQAMNKHIPQSGKSLAALLKEKEPMIKAKDGNEYIIEKEELEFIAQYVDELDWERFKLPIILEMNDVYGERIILIRDKLQASFIKDAFGFDRFNKDGALLIYLYELGPVRRKLKTASNVMFKAPL
ncbi:MAG: DUF61 family protein [Archaeoglobaceae archaeon]